MKTWTFLILATCLLAGESRACEENKYSDALAPEDAAARALAPPNTRQCPQQPACAIMNPNSLFTRHPTMANGNIGSAGCFAVAKREAGYYLMMNSAGPTFDRSLARRGTNDWFPPTLVSITSSNVWWNGVQCPDPHFQGTSGAMFMYFNAGVSGTGPSSGWNVARAVSADNGATWTADPAPLFTPNATHFPYMPSGIQFNGEYLLAFSWVVKGSLLENAEIHLYASANGIDNWQPRAVPAITTGACGTYDDASANRGRLVVDPNGCTLHMFFSAYRWDNDSVNRHCGRIGHAVSQDGGVTWQKDALPIFEPAADGSNWNSNFVLKPTLVWEPNRVLRLYFEGTGTAPGGLGLATANWPITYCPIEPQKPNGASPIVTAPAPESISLARITSVPNPTRGSTSIGLELSRVSAGAEIALRVFDVSGRLVRELWSGTRTAAPSSVEWDGRSADGTRVAPGKYLARVDADGENVGTHWMTRIE